MKKFIFFFFFLVFFVPLVLSDSRIACEIDRSCCSVLTKPVNNLCWVNVSWSDCAGGTYCTEAHYNYDEGTETFSELHQHHNWASEWHLSNPQDMQNARGGIFERPNFRSYGNVHDGLYHGGGTTYDYYCNSWKCMTNSHSDSGGRHWSEAEGFVWNTSYVGWTSFKCIDTDHCDATIAGNVDGIRLQWNQVPTDNISLVNESLYNCNDCLIIEYNESFSATDYDDDRTYKFVLAVHPKPANWTGIGTATTIYLYYDLDLNNVTNITYGVFRKPYADDLALWMGNTTNYLDKEGFVRDWTEDFYQSFNYPTGYSEENKTDYYNGILSYAYTTLPCVNTTEPTNNFYIPELGRCAVFNVPNMETYYGMWKWDSFNTGLGIISSINATSTYGGWVLNNTIGDWLRVWVNTSNTFKNEWNRTIRQFSLDSTGQSEGGWHLLALNLYNISEENNLNIISKEYFCNETLPSLYNDYLIFNNTDTDSDYLIDDAQGNLGRDGTDIMLSGRENAMSTNWHMLSQISLIESYSLCGEYQSAINMERDYNATLTAYETFWNSSCNSGNGCYWNIEDNTNNYFYDFRSGTDTDIAITPFSLCMSFVWGDITSARAGVIANLLKDNFTDNYSYTSISTSHPSYNLTGGSGSTWDGATWAGVDNFWCLHAMRQGLAEYSYPLSSNITWLSNNNLELMGLEDRGFSKRTPYGAESWNPNNASATDNGLWSSNPYGWGGNVPTVAINDYNIFDVLGFRAYNLTYLPSSPASTSNTTSTNDNVFLTDDTLSIYGVIMLVIIISLLIGIGLSVKSGRSKEAWKFFATILFFVLFLVVLSRILNVLV